MVEVNEYNDLFNSVVQGKKIINVGEKEFSIDMSVEESLAVLQFYTSLYKANVSEKEISKKIIDNVRKTLKIIFSKSYPGLNETILDNFIESRFLDIVSAIAISCGWIKKPVEETVTLGE